MLAEQVEWSIPGLKSLDKGHSRPGREESLTCSTDGETLAVGEAMMGTERLAGNPLPQAAYPQDLGQAGSGSLLWPRVGKHDRWQRQAQVSFQFLVSLSVPR